MVLWHDRKRTFLGLPWSFTVYEFDEERLFISKGFFKTVEDEVRLYRILDLSLTRTLGQKIFGLGTITINSSDKTLKTFELKDIKNPRKVKEQLSNLVERQRDEKRVSSREFMMGESDNSADSANTDDTND